MDTSQANSLEGSKPVDPSSEERRHFSKAAQLLVIFTRMQDTNGWTQEVDGTFQTMMHTMDIICVYI